VIVTGTTPGAMTSAAVIGTEAVVAVLPGSTPRLTPLKLTTDRAQKPVPVNDNVKPGFPAVTAEGFSVLIVGCAKPALENTLETVNLALGDRAIVYHTRDHIEAPNWSRDGKLFYFNSGGRIYTLPVAGGTPKLLDTAPAISCNNDHGISPDGTQLVLGTSSGLALMGNNGTAGKELPVAGQTSCTPVRWWDDGAKTVLASCSADSQPQRLWLVPVDGTPPTALTAPITDPSSHDTGDIDAWQLPAGTYVQYLGGCGAIHLGKLNADGTVSKVSVPNVDPGHSIYVIGVHGGNLDLQAMVAGCGPAQSLLDYDPAAGTATVLLGPPLNGGSVIEALPYPGQQ